MHAHNQIRLSGAGGEGTPATGNKLLLNLSHLGLRVTRVKSRLTVADEDIWISFLLKLTIRLNSSYWQGFLYLMVPGKGFNWKGLGEKCGDLVGKHCQWIVPSVLNLPATLLVVKLQATANLSGAGVYVIILIFRLRDTPASATVTIELSNGLIA